MYLARPADILPYFLCRVRTNHIFLPSLTPRQSVDIKPILFTEYWLTDYTEYQEGSPILFSDCY